MQPNKKTRGFFTISMLLLLFSSAVLLSGCEEDGIETIAEASNELEVTHKETVKELNLLLQEEAELQTHFEETLEIDDDLTSLGDGTSAVFANLSNRIERMERLGELEADYALQAEILRGYEGELLDANPLDNLAGEVDGFSETLATLRGEYQDTIEAQEVYFESLAEEEATYDILTEGIHELNEQHENMREDFYVIDEELSLLAQDIEELQQTIQGLQETEVALFSTTVYAEGSSSSGEETVQVSERETTYLEVSEEPILSIPNEFPRQFLYESFVDIDYPEDGVKGIFLKSGSARGQKLDELTELINSTALNSMVIDVKDDDGTIVMDLDSDHEYVQEFTREDVNAEELMQHLEEHNIYPIARIVIFKDSRLARARPDLSFTDEDGEVWSNRAGASFLNPYEREVWEHNVEVAKQAAALGFQDIQFDYVRFPEGFATMDEQLNYSRGEYGESGANNVQQRVDAVTDFITYAREELKPYDVDLSVDIFGFAALVREEPNIGQSFTRISENVDVISSMIYPSHWGRGNLGIAIPDLEPYNLVYNYMEVENEVLAPLGEEAPTTRPWLQAFTASYLGAGNYMVYGDREVSEQIRALHDHGVQEYLLWNSANNYSDGVTFDFNNQ